MRRLTFLVVLVAFIFSCGGHWVILQGLAWANMVREYSEVVPFTEAVQMTLSGKYPCAICQAIAEKKNSEQAKILTLEKQETKMVAAVAGVAVPFPVVSTMEYVFQGSSFSSRSDAPPTPPPRGALS